MNAPAYAQAVLTRLDIISAERLARNGHGLNGVTLASVEILVKPDKPVQPPTPLRNPDGSDRRPDSPPAAGMRRWGQAVKGKLSRGMCRVGLHRGDWGYVTEGKCSQMRECRGCGSIHARTRHKREWRYLTDRSCGQVRTCMRCHTADKQRVRHEKWSDSWDAGGDEMAHECLRCGVVERWTVSDGD